MEQTTKLKKLTKAKIEQVIEIIFQIIDDLKMRDILESDLNKHGDEITEVVDGSSNEIRTELQLKKLSELWSFHIKVWKHFQIFLFFKIVKKN
jgi:hypothetical protein